jgi:hypothetical protein
MQSHVTITDSLWLEATKNILARKVSVWKSYAEIPEILRHKIELAESFMALLSFRTQGKEGISVTFTISDAISLKRLLED